MARDMVKRRAWNEANRDRIREINRRADKKRNQGESRKVYKRAVARNRYKRYYERLYEQNRNSNRNGSSRLLDRYVRVILSRGAPKGLVFPPELIELKRLHLQLRRALRGKHDVL